MIKCILTGGMNLQQKRSFSLILLINIVIFCLHQYLFFYVKYPNFLLQLLYFLFTFLPLNLWIWRSKFKVNFYSHWLCIYIGLLFSTFLFFLLKSLTTDKSDFLSEGEFYFDLFLTNFVFSFVELLILIYLNGVTYILRRLSYH